MRLATCGGLCLLLALAGLGLERWLTFGVVYGTQGLRPQPLAEVNPFGANVFLDRVVDDGQLQQSVRMLHEAGFGWVRQLFSWAEIEPEAKGRFWDPKTGRSSWDKWDRIVDAARGQGLAVIARVERPPNWSRRDNRHPERPPDNLDDYGDFIAQFAAHFKGRVRYYQVWNEPNRYEDWGYQPIDPPAYVRMLKLAYRRIKAVDPQAVVLSAALTPTTERSAKNLDDLVYLQRMYDLGARDFFDVLAAQAYGLRAGPDGPADALARLDLRQAWRSLARDGNTNFSRVALVRRVMERNGDASKPIWATEYGWNALPPDWRGNPSPWGSVTPQVQAAYMVRGYQRAWAEWPWLGVMNAWFFQWVVDPEPADPTPYFALVDGQFQPTPAFRALAHLATTPRPARVGYHLAADQAAAYSGTWGPAPGGPASSRASPASGARVALRFFGNEVAIRALRGPAAGILRVAVDGAPTLATGLQTDPRGLASVDLYSPTLQPESYVLLASGLPLGEHTLELTVSGLKNERATDVGCQIDAFVVGRTRDPLPDFLFGLLAALGLALCAVQAGREGGRRGWWSGAWAGRAAGAARGAVAAAALALPFHAYPLRAGPLRLPASEWLLLAAGGASFLAWLLRGAPLVRPRGWRLPATFAAVATLSLFASAFPRYSLREYRLEVLEPVALYLVVVTLCDHRWAVRTLQAAVLGGAVAAAVGLATYALGARVVDAYGVRRMLGLYPSPDHLALYMERLAPVALALALGAMRSLPPRSAEHAQKSAGKNAGATGHTRLRPPEPSCTERWWSGRAGILTGASEVVGEAGWRRGATWLALAWFACILAIGLNVLLSFSRGGWLGLGVGLTLMALWLMGRWRWPLVAAGTVAAVAVALAARSYPVLNLLGASTQARLHLWQAAWAMLRDGRLLTGAGMDNFLYLYQRYRLPAAAAEPTLSHPHNLVLDAWLSLGLLGLPVLAWLFGRAFALAWRAARRRGPHPADPLLAIGLAASLAAGLAHGVVDNSYFLVDLAAWTWLALGALEHLAAPREGWSTAC